MEVPEIMYVKIQGIAPNLQLLVLSPAYNKRICGLPPSDVCLTDEFQFNFSFLFERGFIEKLIFVSYTL